MKLAMRLPAKGQRGPADSDPREEASGEVIDLASRTAYPVVAQRKGKSDALALAVRACVDSFWTERRSPDSVRALLAAGGNTDGIAFPSGYAEVDELLRRAHR